MDVDSIREYCMSFPNAKENVQWGDDLCFKVGGKIFAIVNLEPSPQGRVCFKCTPDTFAELCERDGIGPAPYVGRYKWVILKELDTLSWRELKPLIAKSYELVASKLPRGKKAGTKKRRK
jgi:predicted DNA-binding protein (MmcQ/YjbR family)